MSPIPSVTATSTLPPLAPSVISNLVSGGQSASMTSIHLLGTGGLLFAVVAIVSVAGYFYHGRMTANGARSGNTWTSLTNILSGIRHRGMDRDTSKAATAASPHDLEIGLEHVNMVYARFFHPTSWDVVECHPGTPSTPTIFVEDEAKEDPASRPTPPGMSSFLEMDDEPKWNADGGTKRTCEKPGQGQSVQGGTKVRISSIPPYDTTLGTDVNFSSAVIGTTVRPDTFLPIPGGHEHDEPEPVDDALHEDSSDSSDTKSEFDDDCSPYDGVIIIHDRDRPLPPLPSNARRYGMADMSNLALSLQDGIPVDGYGLVPTFSRRVGLVDATEFDETDAVMSCHLEGKDDWPRTSECETSCCSRWPIRGEVDRTMFWDPVNHFESVDDDSEDVTNVDCHLGDQDSCDGLRTIVSTTNTDITVYKESVTECDVGACNTCDGLQSTANATDVDIGAYEETYGPTTHDFGVYGGCDGFRSTESATDTDLTVQERTNGANADFDIDIRDGHDGLRSDGNTTSADDGFQEGLLLMEQILLELRNPDFPCTPRDLSEDSNSETEYSDGDERTERKSVDSVPSVRMQVAVWEVPALLPTLPQAAYSVDSAPFARINDELREAPVLPPTRPLNILKSRATAPIVRKGHKRTPALKWINGEAEVTPATPCKSLPSFQGNVNLVYDPRIQEIHHYARG